MKRGRDLINLPVIDADSGKHLGTVRELVLERDHRVRGLIFISPAQETLYLPLNGAVQIGRDAVLARSRAVAARQEDHADRPQIRCAGSWVMTDSGVTLGTVEDIIFEEEQGKIVGLEVSDGYVKDLLTGRRILAVDAIRTFGGETLIVNESRLE